MHRRPVAAVNEQDALGPGMQAVRANQEIDGGHVREMLVRDDESDLRAGSCVIGQRGQGCGGGGRAADLVVGLVTPAQIASQRLQPRPVIGNQQEDRPLHDAFPGQHHV